jgi:polyhydroxyalkanoate synthesis regulator phasin
VLEWDYRTGDEDIDAEAERLRQLRAELAATSREVNERTARLAQRLVTDGRLSVREAATLLAVSPARIDQLVQKSKAGRGTQRRAA